MDTDDEPDTRVRKPKTNAKGEELADGPGPFGGVKDIVNDKHNVDPLAISSRDIRWSFGKPDVTMPSGLPEGTRASRQRIGHI